MQWIKVEDQAAPEEPILVFCNICRSVHSVIFDYGEHCLIEYCHEDGAYTPGRGIKFDYWMPLPTAPQSDVDPHP